MSAFASFASTKPAVGAFGSSLNTAAPTTSAFGAFAQPQQQPSLFGNSTTGTSVFGANPSQPAQQQQQQPSTTLFGSTFGQPQQQQQQPQTGLFGQQSTTTQPSTGLNLFGQPSNSNAQQQQQQNTAGAGTGLFGTNNTAFQNTQSQGTGTGGFGVSAGPQASQQFNQPAASTTSFFAQPAQPSQQQQQQQQSQLQQSTAGSSTSPLFTRATKFNDLPEEIKKKFEEIDAHIQGRIQIGNELKQHKLGEEPQKGSEQIRAVCKDLVAANAKLGADSALMRELREKMDQAVQDTIAATRIIDAFKSPQSAQQTAWLKNYAGFPLDFFTRVTEQLRERLQWFNNTIEQIERKLASEAANHASVTPQAITSALQAQHVSFLALANKTAALDAELQKLKTTYRQLWRARTGSARDPFNELDRGSSPGGEFGLEGLSIR